MFLVTSERLLLNHITLFKKFKSLIFPITDRDKNGSVKLFIKSEPYKELSKIVDMRFLKMKVVKLI